MNKKIFLLVYILLIGPINGMASFRAVDAFAVLDKDDFKFEPATLVPNMPKVESQDTLGICFGFSAGVCAQQYYCQKKKIDCKNLTPDQKISPLQMAAFSTRVKQDNSTDPLAYDKIPNSGNATVSLISAMELTQLGFADSCFPWDQFVSKYGDDPNAIGPLFEKLRDEYNKKNTEGRTCPECLSNVLKNDFNLKIDNVRALEALGAKSYEQFLYSVFFKRDEADVYCPDMIDFGMMASVGIFPKEGEEKPDYASTMKTIKEVIQKGSPVNLGGICIEKLNGKCACTPQKDGSCREARHAVAIAGYRKACRQTPECQNQCSKAGCYVESLKVHNSWGKRWQDEYDDGWVDAKTLLQETELNLGAISWVFKAKK